MDKYNKISTVPVVPIAPVVPSVSAANHLPEAPRASGSYQGDKSILGTTFLPKSQEEATTLALKLKL